MNPELFLKSPLFVTVYSLRNSLLTMKWKCYLLKVQMSQQLRRAQCELHSQHYEQDFRMCSYINLFSQFFPGMFKHNSKT